MLWEIQIVWDNRDDDGCFIVQEYDENDKPMQFRVLWQLDKEKNTPVYDLGEGRFRWKFKAEEWYKNFIKEIMNDEPDDDDIREPEGNTEISS